MCFFIQKQNTLRNILKSTQSQKRLYEENTSFIVFLMLFRYLISFSSLFIKPLNRK